MQMQIKPIQYNLPEDDVACSKTKISPGLK